MTSALRSWAIVALGLLWLVGCASAPQTRSDRTALMERADLTLAMMTQRDPSLERLLANSAGYVVIPDVGEGGFLVGAQQGVGVVYERGGNPIGFAVLRQGSVGAQVGARSFGELIVLRTPEAMNRLRNDNFDMTAQAQATVLESGAADGATTSGDTTVFIDDESGLMASAAIGGQMIDFEPLT